MLSNHTKYLNSYIFNSPKIQYLHQFYIKVTSFLYFLLINCENRRQKLQTNKTKNSLSILFSRNKIKAMNKVSIINFNLHKKFVIDDQKDYMPQPNFKSSSKGRNKSPQQTLKKLIKKGLAQYTNPYTCTKSGKRLNAQKENLSAQKLRYTQCQSFNRALIHNKSQTSNSVFTCSRNHGLNGQSKYRTRTQQKQSVNTQSSYLFKKRDNSEWDEFFPSGNQVFRQFRNISQQTLSRLNVQNDRRNIKLNEVHKVRYDNTWKKYPTLFISKYKSKIYQNNLQR